MACIGFRPRLRPRVKMEGAAGEDVGGQQSLLRLACVAVFWSQNWGILVGNDGFKF
jgi:hypothetical protein